MGVDPLGLYNEKRDFKKTAEPKGKPGRKTGGNSFVVQKHDATRLHWDFRLEADGVLKSWAVTRGPSLDPDDKRLAVRTEDHPLDYGTFEGTIPKGEYGGGTVMLWDRGTWEPIPGKSAKDIEDGHLHFILHGERMKGEWLLVRMKPRPKEKHENWLLRKVDDEFARKGESLVERELVSVDTGRTMQGIAEDKKTGPKSRGNKAVAPAFEPPQLATLADEVPQGEGWIHETKYDGYRLLVATGGETPRVYTRSGLDWSDKFPALVTAAKKLNGRSALLDGEFVVPDEQGKPSFSALQAGLKAGNPDGIYFVFDILSLDGEDLKPMSNLQRKDKLHGLIPADTGVIRFADHIIGHGDKLLAAMCDSAMEGVVSKRADAPYRNQRTHNWIKTKCRQRQEFVVVGWTNSTAAKRGFGALLVATRQGDNLTYSGKVGTGYDEDTIDDLSAQLDRLSVVKPAVTIPASGRRGVHWVSPELVVEVEYAELTADGHLRHASYIGQREDKPAREVKLETPERAPSDQPSTVKITHPERVIFPEIQFTKGDLAAYYVAMAEPILQVAAGRPLSLVRCPDGWEGECFFQRHGAENLGKGVRTVDVLEKDSKMRPYLYIDSSEGLQRVVQMGSVELHGWGSLASDIERPDRLIFDLDPDEGLDFADVRRAAVDLKQHLSDMGLISFAMLSGGKGMHVVVPLTPKADWPTVTDFAKRFALALAEAEPQRFVATMAKAKRKGKIFIDWLRNQRSATAVMPYSVRARSGAPVAAPILWSELPDVTGGGQYSVRELDQLRQRATSGQLKGWGVAAQTLPDV
ncbi:MAG: DNA ligase D [Novosphingobium sp.]